MTAPRPPWTPGEHDVVVGCRLIVSGYPPPSEEATPSTCAVCGRPVWATLEHIVVPSHARVWHLCVEDFIAGCPPAHHVGVSPRAREYLDRTYGPRDWDQVARDLVARYRDAD